MDSRIAPPSRQGSGVRIATQCRQDLENMRGFEVGDRVLVNGEAGILKFMGKVHFKVGSQVYNLYLIFLFYI